MITKLHTILRDITERRRRKRLHLGLAAVWWIGLLLGLLLWKLDVSRGVLLTILLPLLIAASIAVVMWSQSVVRDPRRIAKDIESENPALKTALLAALDQKIDPAIGSRTYLQNRVILEALVSANRDQWLDRHPTAKIRDVQLFQLVGLALLAIALMLISVPRKTVETVQKNTPVAEPVATVPPASFSVEPGNVEIERSSPLTIQARFDEGLPESAMLEFTSESGTTEKIPLIRPFSDPVFQVKLPAVNAPAEYRVTIPGGESPIYQIRLFEMPALKKADAVLHFPEHFGKPAETLTDVRKVDAVEQSRLELSLLANLPDLTASLVAKDHPTVSLQPSAENAALYQVTMTLIKSVRYEIVLTDAAGRRNSRKDFIEIKIAPNKPPVVEVVMPRKNQKATSIQEVMLEARFRDDSEVLSHGLRYTLDGKEWYDVQGISAAGEKAPMLSHRVDFEKIHAKPNDVLMWNGWAEDRDARGKVRRVNGDIHLVQVREFDEEFYQQAAPPGQSGPPSPTTDLIKTQTEILNATWSIRRDHSEISSSAADPVEIETLWKSQEIAIEKSREVEAELTDPELRQFVADARLAMQDAVTQIKLAANQADAVTLDEAIAHEQTALRLLYQLASSKTLIMTGSQGQPSGSQESPPEDLDLKPMETPYQSEKSPQPEAGEQAREAMEILQRLTDLAKRQRDLNDEIQSLQMELKEAETAEKKAEMERRLKQLRDQHRELLEDMDRLQEKTAEPEQTAASDAQNQALEEAREKARQANEQLEESKLGEALAAGRRSQDSLEKLEDDFRETSAAKLAEQLRELRQEARSLDEKQQALSRTPEPMPAADARPSLSHAAKSNPEIQQQREALEALTENMRQTAESAESSEPLVAGDLAEALRQADQAGIAKALEKMAAAGDPAAEQSAGEGISKLNQEVSQAAERILGNEAQTLKYAREELERLAAEAGGEPSESPGDGESQESGEGQQPGEGNQPSEGNQPGEGDQPSDGNQRGEGSGEGQSGRGSEPNATGAGGGNPGGINERNSAITNGEFRDWSDRLQDLEAVIDDPRARSAVAKARKASTELRKDFKRHSKEPDEAAIQTEVLAPLVEARKALDERLRELNKENPLAPVGNDPVPDRYSDLVRRYFEELGK